LDRVVEAVTEENLEIGNKKVRKGYFGHIKQLSNDVLVCVGNTSDSLIKSLVEGHPEWKSFVGGKLHTMLAAEIPSDIWRPSDELRRQTTFLKTSDIKVDSFDFSSFSASFPTPAASTVPSSAPDEEDFFASLAIRNTPAETSSPSLPVTTFSAAPESEPFSFDAFPTTTSSSSTAQVEEEQFGEFFGPVESQWQ